MNIKEEGNKNINCIKYIRIGEIIKEGKNHLKFNESKLLLSYKNQFSNIIELKPKNIMYDNDLFFSIFTGPNIFILKISQI